MLRNWSLSRRFSPLSLYSASQKGLWADPSDLASAWQDSAGSTPGAVNSPVGKRNDKSGRANHLLQATAAARPTLKLDGAIYSDLFDGVDDGYATAVFPAGTLTNNMDCFVAIKRSGAGQGILAGSSVFFGCYQSGDLNSAGNGVGAVNTYFVNGVAVPGGVGTTRAQLDTALTVGSWVVLEVRNLDLSAWTAFGISTFAGFLVNGNIGGIVLREAMTAAERTQVRQYLAGKVGATVV